MDLVYCGSVKLLIFLDLPHQGVFSCLKLGIEFRRFLQHFLMGLQEFLFDFLDNLIPGVNLVALQLPPLLCLICYFLLVELILLNYEIVYGALCRAQDLACGYHLLSKRVYLATNHLN